MADYLFGTTDLGKVRDNNEDVYLTEEISNGQFIIAGVIDGVGGYEGGEVAAAVTKEAILSELTAIGADVIAQLCLAFSLANEEILSKKLLDPKLSEMACVATVAVIDRQNNQLHYVHVGDTRLYLFRDNSLVKLSQDQSFVGFLEDSGRLTETAAMEHPKRNQINQALGLSNTEELSDAYFETGSSPFLPADLILICSDGLTDMVDKSAIAAILGADNTLKVKGAQLIEAANNAGGEDNITVVLVRNDKKPVQHQVSKPISESIAIPAEPAVIRTEPAVIPNVTPHQKAAGKHRGLLILLSFLSLLFLGTSIWLFLKPATAIKPIKVAVMASKQVLNPQEMLIRDMLSKKLKGNILLLSANVFKTPVKLSGPINITQDTLIIQTKGLITLIADTADKGPAFVLSPNCKYVEINQLVLENFETGIVCYKNTAALKNVRFVKVKNALQVFFQFPDHSFINGRLPKKPYLADSIARKNER